MNPWPALAVLCSLLYVCACIPLHKVIPWPVQLVIKVLPALFWAAFVHRQADSVARRFRMSIALVFCALGDGFLGCPVLGANGFTLGLGAFLSAHLCFIATFAPERDRSLSRRQTCRRMLPYLCLFCLMYSLLFPKLLGVMRFAVAAYALALCSMAASTALRRGASPGDSYWSAVVGSSFFLATDSLLSVFHFKAFGPAPYLVPQWAVIVTYYCALAGLARSKMAARPVEDERDYSTLPSEPSAPQVVVRSSP